MWGPSERRSRDERWQLRGLGERKEQEWDWEERKGDKPWGSGVERKGKGKGVDGGEAGKELSPKGRG